MGVDKMSAILNYEDRATCVIFGDGGGRGGGGLPPPLVAVSLTSKTAMGPFRSLRGVDLLQVYFAESQSTPMFCLQLELGSLNIGSRPAKRNPKGGIESLRAIPWQFAWTQTRLHLPAWLGVGEGLDTSDPVVEAELKEMYAQWPFFREMVDLIAMTLSKTDYSISKNYENQLVSSDDATLHQVGEEIRARLLSTRANVLKVTGCDDLYSGFQLRNPSTKPRPVPTRTPAARAPHAMMARAPPGGT